MTENEAIEVLKDFDKQVTEKADGAYQSTIGEMACKLAISALEEIQQYRALGTVEKLRETMEKQRAKKPFIQRTDEKTLYKCPCCKKIFVEAYENLQRGYIPKYCEMCGQSIDF